MVVLVGMVMLGGWLDSIILEVFSKLLFYDSALLKVLIPEKQAKG